MAQASRRKSSTSTLANGWKYLFTGLIIGAGGGWYAGNKGLIKSESIRSEVEQTQVSQARVAPKKSSSMKFDFYNLLPEMEVEVPFEEIKKVIPKTDTTKQTTSTATSNTAITATTTESGQTQVQAQTPSSVNTVYLLQLGSFSSASEADRLKARLAMQGIETDIQNVTISNSQGKTSVYRVRSGPYNQAEIQNTHKSLQQSGINGSIIRVK
jgi:cell division protein FtsN